MVLLPCASWAKRVARKNTSATIYPLLWAPCPAQENSPISLSGMKRVEKDRVAKMGLSLSSHTRLVGWRQPGDEGGAKIHLEPTAAFLVSNYHYFPPGLFCQIILERDIQVWKCKILWAHKG